MIKNYTSTVPVDRTINRIEQALAKAGAASIVKEYGPRNEVAAITFTVQNASQQIAIRLPAVPEMVYEALKKEIRKPQNGTLERLRDQAERTAWKLMQDWVEVQLSLIQMRQAEFLQVFLPYVWDQRQKITFYDQLKTGGFKMLPAPTNT